MPARRAESPAGTRRFLRHRRRPAPSLGHAQQTGACGAEGITPSALHAPSRNPPLSSPRFAAARPNASTFFSRPESAQRRKEHIGCLTTSPAGTDAVSVPWQGTRFDRVEGPQPVPVHPSVPAAGTRSDGPSGDTAIASSVEERHLSEAPISKRTPERRPSAVRGVHNPIAVPIRPGRRPRRSTCVISHVVCFAAVSMIGGMSDRATTADADSTGRHFWSPRHDVADVTQPLLVISFQASPQHSRIAWVSREAAFQIGLCPGARGDVSAGFALVRRRRPVSIS